MIKSIIVLMESDDNLNTILVMIPITDALKLALKKCKEIISTSNNLVSEVGISPAETKNLTFASEQNFYTFKSESLEYNEPKILNYALKAHKSVFLMLFVDEHNLNIRAVDDQDFSYGFQHPVSISLGDVMK